MNRATNAVQRFRPINRVYFVQQSLGFRNIFDVRKTIFATNITHALFAHLTSEILTTIDADLNVERKPCLNTSVHKTENRMNFVMINEFTFSISGDEFEFLDVFVTEYFK